MLTASVTDIAAAFYKMGSAKNRKAVRAPLWPKGNCYFILNTVIQEAHIILSHLLSESSRKQHIIEALEQSIRGHDIAFIPNTPAPDAVSAVSGSARDPSLFAFTRLMQMPVQRAARLSSQPRTARELAEIQLAEANNAARASDPNAPWTLRDRTVNAYRTDLDRARLPNDWQLDDSFITRDLAPYVKDIYQWAEQRFKTDYQSWKCQLAITLAFLLSRMTPTVFWALDGPEFDTLKTSLKEINRRKKSLR